MTARQLSKIAKRFYADAPFLARFMARYRPYIAPFDVLIEQVPPNTKLLDIGCGIGLFIAFLAANGKIRSAHGIDVDAAAIGLANDSAANYRALLVDGLRFGALPVDAAFPAGEFDVVSVIDVMHHVPPVAQLEFLGKCAARIGPGGLLLYKDMCRRPMWRATMNRLHDLVLARQWISYLPVVEVEKYMSGIGFELVASRDDRLLWYGHEMRCFRRVSGN